MFATLLIATVILSILSLLPLWRHEAWWVRSLDFPRLQLLVISLVLLFMDAVFLDLSHLSTWGLLVIACLTLGLAPYNPPHFLEKLQMLVKGRLVRPIDWFDFFMHGLPWFLLILKGVFSLKK